MREKEEGERRWETKMTEDKEKKVEEN